MSFQELSTSSSRLIESAVVSDANEQFIWVQPQRKSACGGCQSSQGCGTASLSKLFVQQEAKPIPLAKTAISENAQVGDRVLLSLDESKLVKHAFMAYGLPLVGLLMGAVIGQATISLFFDEFGAIAGGFTGIFLAWKLTKKFYRPVMPEVLKVESFK